MDYAAAISRLDMALADIEEYEKAARVSYAGSVEVYESIDMRILEGVSVMKHVVPKVGYINPASLNPSFAHPHAYRWDMVKGALRTLRAGLATTAEAWAMVGPTGPSMKASALHPAIWHAALDLWSNEHYREAVQAAATALELMSSAKTGTNLSGKELFQEVFSSSHPKPGKPRLRFTEIPVTEKHTWINQHEGTRNLSVGAMQLVRNMTTHSLDPLDPNVAFEYLAVLSVLARQVELATVLKHGDPDPVPAP